MTTRSGSINIDAVVKTIGFAAAVKAFDTLAVRAAKLSGMYKALTIDLTAATKATGGLITQSKLLEAANTAQALGVKLTSQEFAKLSKAATIMAQRLGTDAAGAINDLIRGLGRQSPLILDNLGIVVKSEKAYADYAKALGVTTKQLTASEKRLAFQQAAMKALNETVKGSAVSTDGLGNSWLRLKTAFTDTLDAFTRSINRSKALAAALNVLRRNLGLVADALGLNKKASQVAREDLGATNRELRLVQKRLVGVDPRKLAAARAGAAQAKPSLETGIIAGLGKGTGGGGLEVLVLREALLLKKRAQQTKNFNNIVAAENKRADAAENARQVKLERDRLAKRNRRKTKAKTGLKTFAPEVGARSLDEQIELDVKKTQLLRAQRDATLDLTAAEADRREKALFDIQRSNDIAKEEQRIRDDATAGVRRKEAATRKLLNVQKSIDQQMTQMAVGSLANFAAGLFATADAAIQSGQNFGKAMLQMLKATLLSIAQQATVQAIFETAKGFAAAAIFSPTAALHFTAAKVFGSVAAVAGAAGLGLSAASAGGGGASAASAGAGGGRSAAPRSTFGSKRERQKQVTVVEVFFGDSRDRGAQRFARLQTTARIAA